MKDPRTKKPVNIYAIDDLGRTIDIKRGFNNSEPYPNALISYDDIDDDDLRDCLFRLKMRVAGVDKASAADFPRSTPKC